MSVTESVAPPKPFIPPRRTFAEMLEALGSIPADRVRIDPAPGAATAAEAFWIHETECACELVDGTIVETPVGTHDEFFAQDLSYHLMSFTQPRKLGLVGNANILFRMAGGNLRKPDLSFTSQVRVGEITDWIAEWCPDLCVEVLSKTNTRPEMLKKRKEYFSSGCRLVWEFDRKLQYCETFTAPETVTRLTVDDIVDGGDVLTGFTLPLSILFSK